MVVLAIAFALSGPTLATNAFAAGNTGRTANDDATHHRHRLLNDRERGNGWDRPGNDWDPWGHWGAYYGPNAAPL
jgi:hypothetical protein